MEGMERKTLLYGENMLMTEFKLSGGHGLPVYSHPQEQTGDAWTVKVGWKHGAKIIDNSVAIEVFSPVRGGL